MQSCDLKRVYPEPGSPPHFSDHPSPRRHRSIADYTPLYPSHRPHYVSLLAAIPLVSLSWFLCVCFVCKIPHITEIDNCLSLTYFTQHDIL